MTTLQMESKKNMINTLKASPDTPLSDYLEVLSSWLCLQVQNLPVSAFKRNGMQDQAHSKTLGTANFLYRCPHDISIKCHSVQD